MIEEALDKSRGGVNAGENALGERYHSGALLAPAGCVTGYWQGSAGQRQRLLYEVLVLNVAMPVTLVHFDLAAIGTPVSCLARPWRAAHNRKL